MGTFQWERKFLMELLLHRGNVKGIVQWRVVRNGCSDPNARIQVSMCSVWYSPPWLTHRRTHGETICHLTFVLATLLMFLNVNLRLLFSTLPVLPSHVSSLRLRITFQLHMARYKFNIVLYCIDRCWAVIYHYLSANQAKNSITA